MSSPQSPQVVTHMPRPEHSELCALCDTNFAMEDGCMKNRRCNHLYHEPCIAKLMRGRAHGELRCLVCDGFVSENQFNKIVVRRFEDPFTANTMCWICKKYLNEECEVDLRQGGRRTALEGIVRTYPIMIQVVVMDECLHAYHDACFYYFTTFFHDGGCRCAMCNMPFSGRDLAYVRFTSEEMLNKCAEAFLKAVPEVPPLESSEESVETELMQGTQESNEAIGYVVPN